MLTQSNRHSRYLWTLYLLLGLFSFTLTMIGPLVPYLQAESGISYTLAGFHQTMVAVGMVLMGLASATILRKAGIRTALTLSLTGMVGGVLLLTAGRILWFTLGGALLMSLGSTLLLSTVQLCFAREPEERRGRVILEGNMMASVLTMLVPLVLLVGKQTVLGWRILLPFVATLAILLYIPGRKLPGQAAGSGNGHFQGERNLPVRFWIYWSSIFAGVTVEWSIGFWCMSYLLQLPGTGLALASFGTVLLGLASVAGRFVASRLSGRLSDTRLYFLMLGLLLAGFPLYWLQPGLVPSLAGLALCGFATSTFYPLSLALTLKAAPAAPEKASAIVSVASGSAIGLAPFLLGRLADLASLRLALLYVPAGMLLLSLLLLAGARTGKIRSS